MSLCMEYVWRIDHGRAADIWELFTVDGSCELPWGMMVGRDQLKDAWAKRAEQPLLTRHMVSNFHFRRINEKEIAGTVSLTLYVGKQGELPPATPALVGDHIDIYRKESEGTWLIGSRRFDIVFSSLEQLPVTL